MKPLKSKSRAVYIHSQVYLDKAAADKLRFEKELAEWRKSNPEKPKRPLSPFFVSILLSWLLE